MKIEYIPGFHDNEDLRVVEKPATLNIFSTDNAFLNFPQGVDEHPTYYMYRHLDKPYHIDYCFASYSLIQKIENLEIGTYEHWTNYKGEPLIE
jgi:hypothetical protein